MDDPSIGLTGVQVGDQIPEYVIHLTVQRLVMECAANRDYAPVHHDREVAQAHGAPDMFANVMFLQGLYEATVRQWLGPRARLQRLRLKMLGFNCAGDTIACRGRVTEWDTRSGRLVLELSTESARGVTTRGSVVAQALMDPQPC
jgi:acyl dehydratase